MEWTSVDVPSRACLFMHDNGCYRTLAPLAIQHLTSLIL
uniref:Uncharacterized protein n=1 Tax=Rhizophora mucronata TaxID=61149 RepID=A0A2P2QKZ2_RHIMU